MHSQQGRNLEVLHALDLVESGSEPSMQSFGQNTMSYTIQLVSAKICLMCGC